ncbi:MAG: aminoacyl-tRNA hydrolase [Patescibacteria group bacterium]|nr:aminoacyl-tRNA hydrolase [Patescibacteria group bacterium]
MKLIVGLGNIGIKYRYTRHNIGFDVIDAFAREINATNWVVKSKLKGAVAEGDFQGEKIILLKPTTLMNRSGQAVLATMRFYKILPADILIINDDWNLATGITRLRAQGSHGGHNGLKDIITQLKTQEFARLRIGVRPDCAQKTDDPLDFVLETFSEQDQKIILDKIVPEALEKLQSYLLAFP